MLRSLTRTSLPLERRRGAFNAKQEEKESAYPSYLQVSTGEYTLALLPLSPDYALQIMPSAVRLVQLRAAPALELGQAPEGS